VIVVADAGPILHLHWIGCLSWGLPPTQIHVVEQVWTELTQHAPQVLADPRLEREPAVEVDLALQARFSLQSGETAAIAFALKHYCRSAVRRKLTHTACRQTDCSAAGDP
jgi:predicted nucleic acid-binding protein